MADLPKEGDELKKQYLEKALHANADAASGATVSDLFNKDSSIYQKPEPTEDEKIEMEAEKKRNAPKPKPTVDAEGYPIIDQMHTYKEDLAGIINKDRISLERIAMMQATENEKKPVEEKPTGKNHTFLIASIVMIAVGMIIVFAVFVFRRDAAAPAPQVTQKERYIIFAETKQDLDVSNTTKTEFEGLIKKYGGNFKEQDNVMEFIPREGDATNPRIILQDLFAKTNARLSEDLSRSLFPQFFLGLYSKKGVTNPFFLFFTSSYDIAYPRMLKWEGLMQDDLNWLFDTRPKVGTTTPELTFKDRVISNTDARSFEDASGKIVFFYIFLDQNTVLFARTTDTVRMVQDRLRQAKFQ